MCKSWPTSLIPTPNEVLAAKYQEVGESTSSWLKTWTECGKGQFNPMDFNYGYTTTKVRKL